MNPESINESADDNQFLELENLPSFEEKLVNDFAKLPPESRPDGVRDLQDYKEYLAEQNARARENENKDITEKIYDEIENLSTHGREFMAFGLAVAEADSNFRKKENKDAFLSLALDFSKKVEKNIENDNEKENLAEEKVKQFLNNHPDYEKIKRENPQIALDIEGKLTCGERGYQIEKLMDSEETESIINEIAKIQNSENENYKIKFEEKTHGVPDEEPLKIKGYGGYVEENDRGKYDKSISEYIMKEIVDDYKKTNDSDTAKIKADIITDFYNYGFTFNHIMEGEIEEMLVEEIDSDEELEHFKHIKHIKEISAKYKKYNRGQEYFADMKKAGESYIEKN